jgi:hypothetical protein
MSCGGSDAAPGPCCGWTGGRPPMTTQAPIGALAQPVAHEPRLSGPKVIMGGSPAVQPQHGSGVVSDTA